MHSNETKTSEQIVKAQYPDALEVEIYYAGFRIWSGNRAGTKQLTGESWMTASAAWDDAARRLEAEQPAEPQSEGGEERWTDNYSASEYEVNGWCGVPEPLAYGDVRYHCRLPKSHTGRHSNGHNTWSATPQQPADSAAGVCNHCGTASHDGKCSPAVPDLLSQLRAANARIAALIELQRQTEGALRGYQHRYQTYKQRAEAVEAALSSRSAECASLQSDLIEANVRIATARILSAAATPR